jgi:hypothetical protein
VFVLGQTNNIQDLIEDRDPSFIEEVKNLNLKNQERKDTSNSVSSDNEDTQENLNNALKR